MTAPNFYIDIFLQPGEFYFGDRDTRIRTILGSCVAITIWHPQKLIGGMCHYMLPERTRRTTSLELDGRFAADVIQLFLQEIKKSATKPSEFHAKIFGGGNQFPDQDKRVFSVPDRNVLVGKDLLAKHGFQIMNEHMGGNGRRNVMFDCWSGDVWVKHVEKTITQ
jgi:chemotaxis protein CheD